MNPLAWNCPGLRNPHTERELVEIIWAKNPSIMFLTETWANEARLSRTLSTINFDQKWVVPRTTKGGGLVLIWKNCIKLDVVDSHKYYNNAIINKKSDDEWRFTSFHGEPETTKRDEA